MKGQRRFNTREKAAIEVYGKSIFMNARILNLSASGACIEYPKFREGIDFAKGDLVRMTVILDLLQKKHLVNAQVIWTEGCRAGIRFIKGKQKFE